MSTGKRGRAERGGSTKRAVVRRKPGWRRAFGKKARGAPAAQAATVDLLGERLSHPETGPPLSGGDVDADWQRAYSSGEEAVGGSAATPDQDVVDEIGRALGVEQAPDAPVRTSQEILRERDRKYWKLERRAAEREGEA